VRRRALRPAGRPGNPRVLSRGRRAQSRSARSATAPRSRRARSTA
jgi:hypothetical protein